MKGLLLKDFYIIAKQAKVIFFILLIWGLAMIPNNGAVTYIIAFSVLSSSMIVSTFTVDEHADWNKYALCMPVSKRDIVIAKYIFAFLFTFVGLIATTITGICGEIVMNKFAYTSEHITQLVLAFTSGISIGVLATGIIIPLVYMFGVERGRMFIIITYAIPAAAIYVFYKATAKWGITLTWEQCRQLLYFLPVIALVCACICAYISFKIFERKEV